MRRLRCGLAAGILLFTGAVQAFGQQGTASISGNVTDSQGAVLPGVTVLVTNEDTGVYREVTTGPAGSYLVSQLVPGPYRVRATLTGFQAVERRGVVQVGNTMMLNLSLPVGGVEETVQVSAQAPLIDTTSAKVGGNIGTAELSELPAMNRNYFATVALLPGVQFAASNQMGNDTIVAAGQSTQGNNVSVDGGYNADDALGTSAGAQVRTPLEAIQEFQVITSMYDAEFGRASGAIVNAVTKAGTNEFRGVVFGYSASNRLTAKDFFVEQAGLEKPTAKRRDWGGVIGGPIIRNKAHFFFSLERQVDDPNRTRVFPTRPDLNFSIVEDRTDWNTLIRFDHQINANHTWAVRWLREGAPQFPVVGSRQTLDSTQDETDLDQTAVGTLTSVLGNTRVNTVRVARTWEHWWHGNACFRAQGTAGGRAGFAFGDEASGNQALCPPQLNYNSFLGQASTESQGPWDSNYQIEDDYSWFIPNKKGDHDTKFGFRYNYTELKRVSQINMNGTFTFNTDEPFNAADPTTYPERLTIRVPEPYDEFVRGHAIEAYGQDKWTIGHTTFSLGLRYDLEITPLDETDNPLFAGVTSKYPVDKNNIAPRVGITHSLDADGRSVVRGGYGIFYNRTILGSLDDTIEFAKYNSSFTATFPNNSADPGPSHGAFPTDPFLVNGPFVNRDLLNALYPPGTLLRNVGTVIYDTPDRRQPYAHQFTVGYERQLAPTLAVTADYVRMLNRDMFLARNLNPMLRDGTSRTAPITRLDAFGVLGESYDNRVWAFENNGDATYDALNLSVEKRYAQNWSARLSYSLSSSRGTGNNQADKDTYQVLTDMNLDAWRGPSDVDRRHVLSVSGRTEIPHSGGVTLSSTARYMSGLPFTIYNSGIDADQNGELVDPLPAGSYSGTALNAMQNVKSDGGRNGARGPDYFQLDLRAGWRRALPDQRTIEVFLDVFNLTNRANFTNPSGDARIPSTFLVLTNLYGGGGFPRQAELGVRFAF